MDGVSGKVMDAIAHGKNNYVIKRVKNGKEDPIQVLGQAIIINWGDFHHLIERLITECNANPEITYLQGKYKKAEYKDTILHIAVKSGFSSTCRVLLNHCSDEFIQRKNNKGETALDLANQKWNKKIAKMIEQRLDLPNTRMQHSNAVGNDSCMIM
jgi:hypothetical protein